MKDGTLLMLFLFLAATVHSFEGFEERVLKFTQDQAIETIREQASRYYDEPYWYWIPFGIGMFLLLVVFVIFCWCSTIRPLFNTIWWVFIFLLIFFVVWILLSPWLWYPYYKVTDDDDDSGYSKMPSVFG